MGPCHVFPLPSTESAAAAAAAAAVGESISRDDHNGTLGLPAHNHRPLNTRTVYTGMQTSIHIQLCMSIKMIL